MLLARWKIANACNTRIPLRDRQGLLGGDVKRLLAEAQPIRLYVLAAALDFRRGELLGRRWSDLDLNLGTVASVKTVQRVNGRLLMDDTKTEDSWLPSHCGECAPPAQDIPTRHPASARPTDLDVILGIYAH